MFLLVILITTFITVIKLQSAVSLRTTLTEVKDQKLRSFKSCPSLSSREVTVTRMLIGTSVLFIVCLTPNLVFQITCFIVSELMEDRYRSLNFILWSFISFLRVVNCSVNFCVYCMLGSNFRRILYEMCGHCCCVKQNNFEDS